MTSISVVMTVYNGEDFLIEAIDSILAQDFDDYEVICVDDASTDHTSQILRQYGDRIKVITNHRNLTAGGARNRGLAEASGKYIIFLDADDIYERNMLRKAYEKAVENDADVVIFREDKFVSGNNQFIDMHYPEKYVERLESRGFFSPRDIAGVFFQLWNGWAWNKLFRRELITENALYFQRIKSSNDGFFTHTVISLASRIGYINQILIHHRMGNKSSISNGRNKSWYCCFLYLYQLKDFLETEHLYSIYEQSFVNWSCYFLEWNYRTLDECVFESFCKELQNYMINHLKIAKYDKSYFYDGIYLEFVERIIRGEFGKDRFFGRNPAIFFNRNKEKLDRLIRFINSSGGRIAVFGDGSYDTALSCIIDKCSSDILRIDKTSGDISVEYLLVATGLDMRGLIKRYRGSGVKIVDVYSYLTLPLSLEDTIVE